MVRRLSNHRLRGVVAGLAAAAFLWLGCKKEAAPPPATPEAAAPAIENAFQNAAADVKQHAADAANALKSQDDIGAYVRLKSLSERPGLTPEQRRAAYESWMLATMRLQAAATNGNSAAKDLLEQQRATK